MSPATREQAQRWDTASLVVIAAAWEELCDEIDRRKRDVERDFDDSHRFWLGAAGDHERTRMQRFVDAANRAAGALELCVDVAHRGASSIEAARSYVLHAVASAECEGFRVANDGRVSAVDVTGASKEAASRHETEIVRALTVLGDEDARVATAMRRALESLSAMQSDEVRFPADVVLAGPAPAPGADSGDERRADAADAFERLTGRLPLDPVDWATAYILVANSFAEKYAGVGPEVVAGRIGPVPGQGVVRIGLYIPSETVVNLPQDLGDHRSEDPRFDVEDTRVAIYVDYENGMVIARQNPSVSVDGDVRVGVPTVDVQQAADGAVRIQYHARNPLAPDVSTPTHTVNGDIVVSPRADRIAVDGVITDYPALEIYRDTPMGRTETVTIDPADSGSEYGPLVNLPFHHSIGVGTEAFERFRSAYAQLPPYEAGTRPDADPHQPTRLGGTEDPLRVVVVR